MIIYIYNQTHSLQLNAVKLPWDMSEMALKCWFNCH